MDKLDIIFYICDFLDIKDLNKFLLINKLFYEVCNSEYLWKSKILNDYDINIVQFKKIYNVKINKKVYIMCYALSILKIKFVLTNFSLHTYLDKMSIGDNGIINKIPKEIGYLTYLEYISVYDQKLSKIPKEIGQLINLKQLRLCNNNIIVIPKEIGKLINLQMMNLTFNEIKKIPKEIGNLVNLEKLYLGFNNLEKLPNEIYNIYNLEYLYLNNNKIKEISKEINQLINLKELSICNNLIEEIPNELKQHYNSLKIYDIIKLKEFILNKKQL